MDEYIKKQDVIDLIMSQPVDAHYPSWYADLVDKISVADVVPVVRCKDCKYAYINSFSAASGVALCSSSAKVMQQDNFCSYGERKDRDAADG